MLVKAFAAQHEDARPGGRVVLFTSGQHLGPMTSELPYAISKGAIHQMTATLADALADRGITVNTVNPGPTDTGWASDELSELVARTMPRRLWNTPEEAAAVVAWLVSDEAATLTGQIVNAEGGFRRWAR
jgi:3-oxoacyl-[acyl-carrier protein] reductase